MTDDRTDPAGQDSEHQDEPAHSGEPGQAEAGQLSTGRPGSFFLPPVFSEIARTYAARQTNLVADLTRGPFADFRRVAELQIFPPEMLDRIAAIGTLHLPNPLLSSPALSLGLEQHTRIAQDIARSMLPDLTDWAKRYGAILTGLKELLLPANLRPFGDDDWARLLLVSGESGLCLAWAPRTGIVREILDQDTHPQRMDVIRRRSSEITEDVSQSLAQVDHVELQPYVRMAQRAIDAAGDGHWEAALALASTVLDDAVNRYVRPELAAALPPDASQKLHRILKRSHNVNAEAKEVKRAFEYIPALTIAGLQHAFAAGTPGIYNRNKVIHEACRSADVAYCEEFIPVALLAVNAIVRRTHWQFPSADGADEC